MKKQIDEAINKHGNTKVELDTGFWKIIFGEIRAYRVNYIHKNESQKDLWPDISIADRTIDKIREGIIDIYIKAGKDSPKWVECNDAGGWVPK